MSVTSRRTRKAPSAGQLRANPEMGGMRSSRNPWRRGPTKNRTSATLMNEMPNFRDELMNNPLMGYSTAVHRRMATPTAAQVHQV